MAGDTRATRLEGNGQPVALIAWVLVMAIVIAVGLSGFAAGRLTAPTVATKVEAGQTSLAGSPIRDRQRHHDVGVVTLVVPSSALQRQRAVKDCQTHGQSACPIRLGGTAP
jgi:hypothetical protein